MRVILTRGVVAGLLTATVALGCSKASPTLEGASSAPGVAVGQPPAADTGAAKSAPNLSAATMASADTPPAGGAAADAGAARTYVVVPAGTTARYSVQEEFFDGALQRLNKALGITTTVGSTQAVSGQLEVTGEPGAAPSSVGGELVVDISTLASDEQGRDNRIRERWLESAIYPRAVFVPTSLDGFPPSYSDGTPLSFSLTGNLTIHDVTKPVTFQVTASLTGDTLTGSATTKIAMTDFGFDPPDMMGMFKVQDAAQIILDFELQQS